MVAKWSWGSSKTRKSRPKMQVYYTVIYWKYQMFHWNLARWSAQGYFACGYEPHSLSHLSKAFLRIIVWVRNWLEQNITGETFSSASATYFWQLPAQRDKITGAGGGGKARVKTPSLCIRCCHNSMSIWKTQLAKSKGQRQASKFNSDF
jgi:hypothetical protein